MAEDMTQDVVEDVAKEEHDLLPPLIHYNSFFHPNLCHVCKSAEQNKLRPCMKCKMIFYCSENHRLFDQVEHKDICQAIENVIKQRNIWDSCDMNPDQWANFRISNMNILKSKLQRRLKRNEMEIFLNVKSCFICREQQNLVDICHVCKSINMCSNHKFISEDHDCKIREVFLKINIFVASRNEDRKIPRRLLYLQSGINDMTSLIQENLNYSGSNFWPLQFHIYSENLTRPLTLFYGVKVAYLQEHLSMRGNFVIHVIDEYFQFSNTLSAWEIILHEFSDITNLTIIMINSKFCDNFINVELCYTCRIKQKNIQYESFSMEYYKYRKISTYKCADVIIGYDVELRNNQVTMLNLRAMQREYCPIFLASSSKITTQCNIINIQEMLRLHLAPIFNNINKFPSYRPVRDYKNDTVVFPQQYLIVYLNLCSNEE